MKGGGLILWNAIDICEVFKSSWQSGKLLMRGDSESHFNGPVILFVAIVEYYPISSRDQSRLHQFGEKILPGSFLAMSWSRGEFGKEIS